MLLNQNSISHWSADGILRVRVEGHTDVESVVAYAYEYSDTWVQHACILYDFTQLDPNALTSTAIKNLPESFASIVKLRAGGRTALVVPNNLELIAKIIVAQSEATHGLVEHRAFCSEDDAVSWLQAI